MQQYKTNTVEYLSSKTGLSRTVIYRIAKKLGRYPTLKELYEREKTKKVGRPSKE